MSDNPFDQLGLKKSIVEYLVRTNQLEDFLRDYHRITQVRVHPDKGGDHGLAALINGACSDIRRNPGKVNDWLSGMQNGNTEYLGVIEALVEKVERLQKVETENEDLRRKYAEALVGGASIEPKVRVVHGRPRPKAAPRIVDEPEIKTPPRARRAEPEAEKPIEPIILVEPILIEGIACVGSDGKVFERHEGLYVDGDVIRDPRECYSRSRVHKHVSFTPYQAISQVEKLGSFVPDYPTHCNLLVAIFRRAVEKQHDGTYKTVDAKAKAILDQYKNYGAGHGWHNSNTVVDGVHDKMIFYPGDDDFPEYGGSDNINADRKRLKRSEKPFVRGKDWSSSSLEDALDDAKKVRFLKDITGLENPKELLEISAYFGRTAWFYPPSKGGVWAAWLGCLSVGRFNFGASNGLGYSSGVRGVRRG
jgi:hypothetical protein